MNKNKKAEAWKKLLDYYSKTRGVNGYCTICLSVTLMKNNKLLSIEESDCLESEIWSELGDSGHYPYLFGLDDWESRHKYIQYKVKIYG